MRRVLPVSAIFVTLWLSASMSSTSPSWAAPSDGPGRWESAIRAFEKQDRKTPPSKNSVLFAGSSSIVRWDVSKYFPDLNTINRGFGGSQIADSVYFADRIILKYKPAIVVLYAGDNDIARGKTSEQVAADFESFVKKIREDLPQTRIVFIAIKPSLKRWGLFEEIQKTNALIAASCEKDDASVSWTSFSRC